jgi:hypothetical protein
VFSALQSNALLFCRALAITIQHCEKHTINSSYGTYNTEHFNGAFDLRRMQKMKQSCRLKAEWVTKVEEKKQKEKKRPIERANTSGQNRLGDRRW